MINSLYELIKKAQLGNKDCTMEIINTFTPTIKKYCRKLNYDGCDTDLIIHLIETINKIPIKRKNMNLDSCLFGYIHKSLKHKYINLSKKYCNLYKNELELNEDILVINDAMNIENTVVMKLLLNKLTELQKSIVYKIFIKGHSVTEIAKELNISRQAVNKTKIRALNTLKKHLDSSLC